MLSQLDPMQSRGTDGVVAVAMVVAGVVQRNAVVHAHASFALAAMPTELVAAGNGGATRGGWSGGGS